MRIDSRLHRTIGRAALVTATPLLLAACQTLTPDGGTALVTAFASQELNKNAVAVRSDEDALAAKASVANLLRRPLTADAAVQIALLNNKGLQAAYNELGAEQARAVRASLPPNPVLSLSRISGSGELEIERRVIADILALATLPARAEIASQRFRQAQLRAIAETLRVATEARRAYYRTVAARELTGFLAQAQTAAEAATQIAKRLGESGALNKLDQAREQVFYADITTQVAVSRQRAESERERLIRALGLWGADLDFKLVSALPALPRRVQTLPFVETEAVRRRVDLQIARIDVRLLANSYGLTQATRFINLLEVGGVGKTTRRPDGGTIRERGIEVDFQIPLFDLGETRVREAGQIYMEAVNRLTQKAVNVRSEARDTYRIYRSAYDVAAHYQREVLPLRKIISDETLLRYNAMQIDVFALLVEARQRIAATNAAIEAHRDFWLAHTNLFVAIAAGSPGGEVAGPSLPMAATTGEAAAH